MDEEVHGIVIVGGGICGLATALALHRKGIPSLVLEKSENLRAAGGSIGVHVNGWRALDQLGIAGELRETADNVTEFHDVWQNENNKSVVVPVRGELRWVKRKDLIETMAKNIPSGAIRFGCHIADIKPANPGSHGAILTTLDGSIIRAKALIGCDGGNSVVAKYLGLSPPKSFPRLIVRGFTRYPHGHPFGPHFLRLRCNGLFVGRSPMTENLVNFFVGVWHPGGSVTKDPIAVRGLVLEKVKEQCSDEIVEMVRDVDTESLIVLTKIWYRPPWQVMFSSFRRGTATVAGDSMHVMGSYIGQGGSAAMEDAIVLARSLSRAAGSGGGGGELCEKKIGAAMAEYVRERRLRVVRLSLESFAMGMIWATKSMLAKLACQAIVAVLGTHSLGHTNYDCGRL
ncbi:hypothetical protein HU200_062573 [Digitaria exilis]|uniref:FAD-binding domain-containing protein n=1 Tax=Digitaria exilis TaxID=1010633 RepID=A0A835A362_9POAL|nr:hypothetical protein HU200_062573 [Digitaria exilis]CAB3446922.1 unnamed protein product [Digitaria exilis]